MITIGNPYIKEMDNATVRLCSIVNYDGKDNEIWYEVDREYGKYLCSERADAFLLAFLPYAMAFKHDIMVDGAVSEKLYYQLTNQYIPTLAKFSNYYKEIRIESRNLDPTSYGRCGNGVGTGFSGGVDAFYTVLKHLNCNEKKFNLTCLTFFKVGATGSYGGKGADESFNYRINKLKSFADEVGLPFVTVDSNISEHAKMSFNYIHTFRSMSAVLALQKLFRIYYYSSSSPISEFEFNVVDSANFDFFNLNCFSVEGMSLYSVGFDCGRLEKQEYIQDYAETYKYLNVCNSKPDNCSRCEKCIRTMAGFHCLGSLERYEKVFDIMYYKKNLGRCIGLLIGKGFEGSTEANADTLLIKQMREKGVKIPVCAYFYSIPVTLHSIAYRTARSIKPIRKWYHKRMSKELGCNYNDD